MQWHEAFLSRSESSLRIELGQELLEILKAIQSEGKTSEEWEEIQSDDMFQSERFIGGYESIEDGFCFSYYDDNQDEYWFQFTLEDVERILSGDLKVLEARPADKL